MTNKKTKQDNAISCAAAKKFVAEYTTWWNTYGPGSVQAQDDSGGNPTPPPPPPPGKG